MYQAYHRHRTRTSARERGGARDSPETHAVQASKSSEKIWVGQRFGGTEADLKPAKQRERSILLVDLCRRVEDVRYSAEAQRLQRAAWGELEDVARLLVVWNHSWS